MLTHICWTSDKCYTSTHLIHLERENRMIFAFKKGTRTLDYIAYKIDVKIPTQKFYYVAVYIGNLHGG